MLENYDGQTILPPTKAEREALQVQARRNQLAIDQQRAKDEAARKANFEKQQAVLAEQFKQEHRQRLAALSDADFERLWETKLRDEALLDYARQQRTNRIAEYQSLMQ